jgi:hypothetical protein
VLIYNELPYGQKGAQSWSRVVDDIYLVDVNVRSKIKDLK